MYNRAGYRSLSSLWQDFQRKHLHLCKTCALACLEAEAHSVDFAFGTALDLCEDVFLLTFDKWRLSLVPLEGEVVEVEPVLANTEARLLLKSTAFESFHISRFPDEAGPDGKWLTQMGSSAFRAADPGWLFPDLRGRDKGEDLEKVLFANVFHTLPILFERSAFVIARDLPPWSEDLLEDTFLRNLWAATRGSSICLPDASVSIWERTLTEPNVAALLRHWIPNAPLGAIPEKQSTGGRPRKLDYVIEAYRELGLIDDPRSRKVKLRLVEEHIGDTIGISTLDEARRFFREGETVPKKNSN